MPNKVKIDEEHLAAVRWDLYVHNGLGEYVDWLTESIETIDADKLVASIKAYPSIRRKAERMLAGLEQRAAELRQMIAEASRS
jgi:hypothetical protein